MRPLQRELKVKTLKLSNRELKSPLDISTLASNFSDANDELDEQDEELLTFSEVLVLMDIPVPELLQEKLDQILKEKRIPVEQNVACRPGTGESKKKNRFLSYTLNKKLSGICDTISLEEVFA